MSAIPASQRKTVDDLIALEESTWKRYEIVDGDFLEMHGSSVSSSVNARFCAILWGLRGAVEDRRGV